MTSAMRCYLTSDQSGSVQTSLARHGLPYTTLPQVAAISDLDPGTSIVVAVASAVRPVTDLTIINQACVARGITWLPIGAFVDGVAHVGPLVVPRASACFCCEQQMHTLEYRTPGYRELEGRPATSMPPPGLYEWRASLAALIVQRWVTASDLRLAGHRFTIASEALTVTRTWLTRSETCVTCAGTAHATRRR